jgi:hypothetical protein
MGNKKSGRPRGVRKPNKPGKHKREAMRRGAESTLEHATSTLANHADTVSDESEGATPDRHTIRHSVEDAPDALPSTPERPTLDDDASLSDDAVSWSIPPVTDRFSLAAEPEEADMEEMDEQENSEPLFPVQPFGESCVVICRLSSLKPIAESKEVKVKRTVQQRKEDMKARRIQEGYTLADRLATNCPAPVQFRGVHSVVGVRHSNDRTSWTKSETGAPRFVKDIRRVFQSAALKDQKVTILIQSVDGVHTDPPSFQSFLEMVQDYSIEAQLIFQYNKICDAIRPLTIQNFKGLGGTADFMAADFLAHLQGRRLSDDVARIVTIWDDVANGKAEAQGIQDRNALPHADLLKPEEVNGVANSAGRRR